MKNTNEMKSYLHRRVKESPHNSALPEIVHQCDIFEERIRILEQKLLTLQVKVNALEHENGVVKKP